MTSETISDSAECYAGGRTFPRVTGDEWRVNNKSGNQNQKKKITL